jgi:outer membrane PBP1 activator LpoA protein
MNTSAPFPKFIPPNPIVGDGTLPKASKVPKVEEATEATVQQAPPSKLSKEEHASESIDALLITLTLAIHDTRRVSRPAWATGRRTTIEDGLAVAKSMDCLDALAKAAASHPELLNQARNLVDAASVLIREWKFDQAHQLLDELGRLANTQRNESWTF